MRNKWKDTRGETLVEVLASILIGALSVALLFSAVMASSNMDRTAEKTDDEFYASLNKAEGQTEPADSSVVPGGAQVTVKNKDLTGDAKLNVTFYGGEGAIAYALSPGSPGGGGP